MGAGQRQRKPYLRPEPGKWHDCEVDTEAGARSRREEPPAQVRRRRLEAGAHLAGEHLGARNHLARRGIEVDSNSFHSWSRPELWRGTSLS